MVETSDPDQIVGEIALVVLVLAGLWRFAAWVCATPITPDPWSAEITASLELPDAQPICHRCLTAYPDDAWFCEHCGSAVGPYNNLMPYVHVFSEGEVFRNGVNDRMNASPLIIGGYFLASLASYHIFAPVYWFWFIQNLTRLKAEKPDEQSEDLE